MLVAVFPSVMTIYVCYQIAPDVHSGCNRGSKIIPGKNCVILLMGIDYLEPEKDNQSLPYNNTLSESKKGLKI